MDRHQTVCQKHGKPKVGQTFKKFVAKSKKLSTKSKRSSISLKQVVNKSKSLSTNQKVGQKNEQVSETVKKLVKG